MIDGTTAVLEKMLDLRMKAHEVHTSNIANANVPQYKARKIEFNQALEEAMKIAQGQNIQKKEEIILKEGLNRVGVNVYEDPSAPMKSNGNTVDMEREQTELAKNTIAYEAAIQMINKKFAMAKLAISEGAR